MDWSALLRDLGANGGLIALLVFALNILGSVKAVSPLRERAPKGHLKVLALALIFGAGSALSLSIPVTVQDDITFNSSQIILALAGYFLPVSAALIATGIAVARRFYIDDFGVWIGVIVLMLAVLSGMAWSRINRPQVESTVYTSYYQEARRFAMLGFTLVLNSLVAVVLLPGVRHNDFIRWDGPFVFVVFPLALVVFGSMVVAGIRLREREHALKLSSTHIRQAYEFFKHSAEGMFTLDARAHFVDANPAFCAMVGYTRSELVGQPSSVISGMDQNPEFFVALRSRLATEGSWEGEITRRRKSGDEFLTRARCIAVRGDDGALQGQVVICTDLTQRLRQEEFVARASRLDLVTGLPNRRQITQLLQADIDRLNSAHQCIGVLTPTEN